MSDNEMPLYMLIPIFWMFSIGTALFGFMVYSADQVRQRSCEAAFGPDATPIESVSDGVLCHVDDGVRIAERVDHGQMSIEMVQSYLVAWPAWAFAIVGVLTIGTIGIGVANLKGIAFE